MLDPLQYIGNPAIIVNACVGIVVLVTAITFARARDEDDQKIADVLLGVALFSVIAEVALAMANYAAVTGKHVNVVFNLVIASMSAIAAILAFAAAWIAVRGTRDAHPRWALEATGYAFVGSGFAVVASTLFRDAAQPHSMAASVLDDTKIVLFWVVILAAVGFAYTGINEIRKEQAKANRGTSRERRRRRV